jgi:hypothetical protein
VTCVVNESAPAVTSWPLLHPRGWCQSLSDCVGRLVAARARVFCILFVVETVEGPGLDHSTVSERHPLTLSSKCWMKFRNALEENRRGSREMCA